MSPEKPSQVELRLEIRIPVRDGVHLNATGYIPKNQREPLPCIVAMTPYIADNCHERGMYFAEQGLPFFAVDVRGRGNSEGTFRPFIQEAYDGYDVVEWLAAQSVCSGKVAMWGGSYLGYCQWATAKEFPPHLATIVPTAAPCIGIDFPMRNSVFYPYVIQWLMLTSGRVSQMRIFLDSTFWSRAFHEWHASGRAFCDLDCMLGQRSSTFQEWVRHSESGRYWDAYNPSGDEYARLDIPILTITGSYDDDQPGALAHYREHIGHNSSGRHYLVIGPWDHGGTSTPRVEFGGLTCGAESLVDLGSLHREWYAWVMQQGPRPAFLKKAVAYYVMGSELWRYADSLEHVTERYETLFLDSVGNADDVYSSGSLSPLVGKGRADTYRYDPRDVQGPEIEAEARADGNSLIDQSTVVALGGKSLVYHSALFEQDSEISGFFKLSVWLAIDCPDTDFYVSVCEISLDGSSVRLSTDAIRARYRKGLRRPELIQTREPLRYDFDRFTFISCRVKRGSRLRLVIAPIGRLVGATFTQKNYNAGGVVADETHEDARCVTVHLFHDDAHPSALYVPVGRIED